MIELLQAMHVEPHASLDRLSGMINLSRYRVRQLIDILERSEAIVITAIGRSRTYVINEGNYIDGLQIGSLLGQNTELHGRPDEGMACS